MASDTSGGTPTSAKVAKLATQSAKLDRTALIGIFGAPASLHALLRLSGGQIARVGVGDTVGGGKVVAIGEDSLALVKGGRNTVLHLPRL